MMKKLFFLASALAVLAACGSNDELPVPAQEQEPITIDLRSMNYEGVMNLLSEQTSLKNVTFTDGDVVKTVSLTASDNVDPQQAEQLMFNAGEKDSLDLTISPDFVAVRSIVNSKYLVYTAYADAGYQAKLADFYAGLFPATRSGEAVVTRGTQSASMKMDVSAIRESVVANKECVLNVQPPVMSENAATRGWFSNLFKKVAAAFAPKAAPVVKTPTVDIYLLKEKGANPLEHEMRWQVDDAIRALKDVAKNVTYNVHLESCDFQGNNDAHDTLDKFTDWKNASKYSNVNGVFALCRWGGFSNLVNGIAWIDTYNVNDPTKENRYACLATCTNSWSWYTMAHEMGHTFGADHIAYKWWQILVPYTLDLMAPDYGAYPPMYATWGLHKDNANRAIIKKNLTLN